MRLLFKGGYYLRAATNNDFTVHRLEFGDMFNVYWLEYFKFHKVPVFQTNKSICLNLIQVEILRAKNSSSFPVSSI